MTIEVPELREIIELLPRLEAALPGAAVGVPDVPKSEQQARHDMRLIDADQASQMLNLSKATIYRYTSAKAIPHLKHGRKGVFPGRRSGEVAYKQVLRPECAEVPPSAQIVYSTANVSGVVAQSRTTERNR